MITINGVEFKNVVQCNRRRVKKQSVNISGNGTVHEYLHGYHYEWDIILRNLSYDEMEKLYEADLIHFRFVDDENYKCDSVIIGDITKEKINGFVKGNRYNATFVISEV